MIVNKFQIKDWNVTIVYEATCDDIDFIIKTLRDINCPKYFIHKALLNLEECELNSGLTYSNTNLRSSVIIINKASSAEQLINTISHEYFHLVCHIATSLLYPNEEELADLNGTLNMYSYKFVKQIIKRVGSE